MHDALSLEKLTLKELGAIAVAANVPRWSRLRKAQLIALLCELRLPSDEEPTNAEVVETSIKSAATIQTSSLIEPEQTEQTSPNSIDVSKKSKQSRRKKSVAKNDAISESNIENESSKHKKETQIDVDERPITSEKAQKSRKKCSRVKKAPFFEEIEAPTQPSSTPLFDASIKNNDKKAPKTSDTKAQKEVESAVDLIQGSAQVDELSKKGASREKKTSNRTKKAAIQESDSAPLTEPSEQTFDASFFVDSTQTRPLTPSEKQRFRKTIGSSTARQDRLLLTVCDSYWLRAYWEATPRLVERIRSAMGRYWHTADPILRLYKIDKEPQGALRRVFVDDVPIRGGVDNWYLDVDDPPSSFMVELGYLSRDKKFFSLISSNVVETPQRCVRDAFGRSDSLELGLPAEFDVFQRGSFPDPFGAPQHDSIRDDNDNFGKSENLDASGPLPQTPRSQLKSNQPSAFQFAIDAEIVVKGKASPGVRIRVKETAVRLKEDGTFSIRYRLPERRHVFPVVAASADGIETQTIVLAIDRNTKILDPVFKDEEEE